MAGHQVVFLVLGRHRRFRSLTGGGEILHWPDFPDFLCGYHSGRLVAYSRQIWHQSAVYGLTGCLSLLPGFLRRLHKGPYFPGLPVESLDFSLNYLAP